MPDQDPPALIITRLEKDYVPDRTIAREDAMIDALNFIAFRTGRIDDKLSAIERALVVIAQKR